MFGGRRSYKRTNKRLRSRRNFKRTKVGGMFSTKNLDKAIYKLMIIPNNSKHKNKTIPAQDGLIFNTIVLDNNDTQCFELVRHINPYYKLTNGSEYIQIEQKENKGIYNIKGCSPKYEHLENKQLKFKGLRKLKKKQSHKNWGCDFGPNRNFEFRASWEVV